MEKKETIDNIEEKTFDEKIRRPFYKNRRKFKRKFHVEVKYFYDDFKNKLPMSSVTVAESVNAEKFIKTFFR